MTAHSTAADWISRLQLQQHIEGGWYGRVYEAGLQLKKETLPPAFKGDRPVCTHIYFLLQQNEFSAFHRIASDELWHFYDGDPLLIYELNENGLTKHQLGNDMANGFIPFTVIKAGSWFGSRLQAGGSFALVGCTVSPGFDFADFELAKADELSAKFPGHKELVNEMCRG